LASARVVNDSSAGGRRVVAFDEERFDRPGALQHLPEHPDQRDDVVAADPAVDDRGEGGPVAARREASRELGRRRPHSFEDVRHGLHDRANVAKRQRGRDEAGHLAVLGPEVRPHELDRIDGRPLVVERAVHPLEVRRKRCRCHDSRGAEARLHTAAVRTP
jgi:hypothetical protein